MLIHLIPGLMATIVVARPHDPASQVLVLVDADQPTKRIRPLARVLLNRPERHQLAEALARR